MRRDVRARPTEGRVAPAKGNAKLPKRPRDEGGPREARPASLHGLLRLYTHCINTGRQQCRQTMVACVKLASVTS
jgi:hypothetical protein